MRMQKYFFEGIRVEVFWVVLVMQGIVFGGFSAFIASQKDRDSFSWFFLGFFFSILAVLALIAIPKREITDHSNANLRTCPYCAEQVKVEATICRFCQKDLPVLNIDLENNAAVVLQNQPTEVPAWVKGYVIIFFWLLGIFLLMSYIGNWPDGT